MKTTLVRPLLLVLAGLSGFATPGCSDSQPVVVKSETPRPATPEVPNLPPTPPPPLVTPPAPLAITAAEWNDIKALGFDDRADFFVGLNRLHARLDAQITALNTRRATLSSTDNPAQWDATLEVLGTARTRLLSSSEDLQKATPQNWGQRRDRVAEAWVNVQSAHDKAAAEAPR